MPVRSDDCSNPSDYSTLFQLECVNPIRPGELVLVVRGSTRNERDPRLQIRERDDHGIHCVPTRPRLGSRIAHVLPNGEAVALTDLLAASAVLRGAGSLNSTNTARSGSVPAPSSEWVTPRRMKNVSHAFV